MDACANYLITHPNFHGQPSFTCRFCENRKKIREDIDSFVIDQSAVVNCQNFKPTPKRKDTILDIWTMEGAVILITNRS